jgi:hypothetical protein
LTDYGAAPVQTLEDAEATIEASVIRSTLTVASGERRAFYGWLEFNTAIEAALRETGPEGIPTALATQIS